MKRIFTFSQILLLTYTVFGADEVKTVTVMEGDSVTLNPNQDVQGIILVQWRFGDKGSTIAQISGKSTSYPEHTKIFTDRLKLKETGSLTIINMRTKHSGRYQLVIDHSKGNLGTNFDVTVSEPQLVIETHKAQRQSLSVTEGNPVTLHTDITKLHGDELIVWRFGDDGKLLVKEDKENKRSSYYNTDERFRHRLELNDQTGSLTIKNMKDTDAGLYTVKINSNNNTLYKEFTVIVTGSGLSPGAVAAIVVVVSLLVGVAVAVLGFFYHLYKIPDIQILGKTVVATEEDNVILYPVESLIYDELEWMFGNKTSPIAKVSKVTKRDPTYPDGKFHDRLHLDRLTGSLEIRNIQFEDTGEYKLKIIHGKKTKHQAFFVDVKASLYVRMEDEEITIRNKTKLNEGDKMEWLFGNEKIAQMEDRKPETYVGRDEMFKDRLKLDIETGSLTINNVKTKHSGDYTLKIISSRDKEKSTERTFKISFKEENVSVEEKKPFTLKLDTKIQEDDKIEWMYQGKPYLITEMTRVDRVPKYHSENFGDRLKLDTNTGSLTINKTRPEDSGEYSVKISSRGGTTIRKFPVSFASNGNQMSNSATEGSPLLDDIKDENVYDSPV